MTDWFGAVPSTWTKTAIRYHFEVTLGKMLNASKKSTGAAMLDARYLAAGSIQAEHLAIDDSKTMPFSTAELERYSLIKDDLVVVEGGAGYGRSHLLSESPAGWGFQNHVVRLRATGSVAPAYLLYCLACLASGYIEANNRTATLPSLSGEVLGSIRVPMPPIKEQHAITDFLDRETAQIDTLTAKQEQLIETLRERRDAVVSHTLTSSTAARTALRRVAEVIDCAHVTAEFVDDDHHRFPVASIRECQGATVDLSTCGYTTRSFYDLLRSGGRAPTVGDLLFIRNVSVGLVSVVGPGTAQFAMGQETVLLRRSEDVDPWFLRYALTTSEVKNEIDDRMIGSTFRRINVSAIRSLPVPLPPLAHQRAICANLDEQTAKIDTLISKAEQFIALSKERRSALIAAAVTGQIDVLDRVA